MTDAQSFQGAIGVVSGTSQGDPETADPLAHAKHPGVRGSAAAARDPVAGQTSSPGVCGEGRSSSGSRRPAGWRREPRGRSAPAAPAARAGCRRRPGTAPGGRTSRRVAWGWAASRRSRWPAGSPPRGPDLALGGPQVGLVGLVAQHLAAAEVEQLQQPRHLAAQPPQHQRVEPHLEHRLGLEALAGRPAGLVVDHPQGAGRRDVEPVDVAAQPQAGLEVVLDEELALGGLEPRRVLEREVGVEQVRRAEVEPLVAALRRRRTARRARARPRAAAPTPARPSRGRCAGVRSAAGRSNSRSSTAWTTVPRVAAGLGRSGSRSITRNR